jgi:hypothetical protein
MDLLDFESTFITSIGEISATSESLVLLSSKKNVKVYLRGFLPGLYDRVACVRTTQQIMPSSPVDG